MCSCPFHFHFEPSNSHPLTQSPHQSYLLLCCCCLHSKPPPPLDPRFPRAQLLLFRLPWGQGCTERGHHQAGRTCRHSGSSDKGRTHHARQRTCGNSDTSLPWLCPWKLHSGYTPSLPLHSHRRCVSPNPLHVQAGQYPLQSDVIEEL